MATWMERNGLAYALLRLDQDPRPSWAASLGLRCCVLNGVELAVPPPRLNFKRRVGSFVAHPRANDDYRARQEAHYDHLLRQLKDRLSDRAA